ncbi:ABC transporter ATP-binding protein [Mycoplasmopsis gallopavonis]|uniref:ABC-type multidrug/protein/lipid transport system ATPase component n=2 Tax=Mycoplasmopsis gallopavonis TaxID=76629 RepID=A0A449AZV4_9BACT|nr:ABC transporter ATP-binding protein [Mycoplasmopsis gallopavonis]VEU73048.1 ABC-type multidrug/protein/lipid transport system ATPase component [Mycoplasmopsis gallopavonis]
MIDGIKVVKVFNHQQEAIADFKKKNDELFKNDFKSKVVTNLIMPIMSNMGTINFIVMAFIGGMILTSNNQSFMNAININVGVLISFLLYARSFSQPIGTVAQQLNALNSGLAGARRVFEVLDFEPEVDYGKIRLITLEEVPSQIAQELTNKYWWKIPEGMDFIYKPAVGHIKFENVSFGYTKDKLIIDDFSLNVQPGQKVALVGATGAGKTTIANLLNRFYEVTEGSIYFDQINIKDIKKDDLRRAYGLVLQDTSLFSKTIEENITYALQEYENEALINAAQLANANEFIEAMQEGYKTQLVNAGENLSQGQKQLLSIARTTILNPLVLILDEATSTIDTETERKIQNALTQLLVGKTAFVIAHRLSTIKNCDLIVVLDQGKIIEQGTHKQLLELKEHYYNLYTGKVELD